MLWVLSSVGGAFTFFPMTVLQGKDHWSHAFCGEKLDPQPVEDFREQTLKLEQEHTWIHTDILLAQPLLLITQRGLSVLHLKGIDFLFQNSGNELKAKILFLMVALKTPWQGSYITLQASLQSSCVYSTKF